MNQTKIKIISYLIASISIACLNKHLFNSLFFPIFDVTGFQLFATFISIFIGFEVKLLSEIFALGWGGIWKHEKGHKIMRAAI